MNKRKAVTLLAIGLAVVVGCGTAEALSSEARVQAAQAAERLETAYDGIETSVARGDSLLRSTTTADVADATTLSDLDMALHQAHAALDEGRAAIPAARLYSTGRPCRAMQAIIKRPPTRFLQQAHLSCRR